jgi:hypothetical protein
MIEIKEWAIMKKIKKIILHHSASEFGTALTIDK